MKKILGLLIMIGLAVYVCTSVSYGEKHQKKWWEYIGNLFDSRGYVSVDGYNRRLLNTDSTTGLEWSDPTKILIPSNAHIQKSIYIGDSIESNGCIKIANEDGILKFYQRKNDTWNELQCCPPQWDGGILKNGDFNDASYWIIDSGPLPGGWAITSGLAHGISWGPTVSMLQQTLTPYGHDWELSFIVCNLNLNGGSLRAGIGDNLVSISSNGFYVLDMTNSGGWVGFYLGTLQPSFTSCSIDKVRLIQLD